MIRVVIADDHPVVREGIKGILQEFDDLDVVAELENGEQLLTASESTSPDVILLDISMPGPGILPLIKTLRHQLPETKILVLSFHSEESYSLFTIKAGASGYITKNQSPEVLANAIRHVHQGNLYISQAVSNTLVRELNEKHAHQPRDRLSRREYQVLALLGDGMPIKDIATQLNLSPKTVSTYKARIKEKLKLSTSHDLIRYVIENGIHPWDDGSTEDDDKPIDAS